MTPPTDRAADILRELAKELDDGTSRIESVMFERVVQNDRAVKVTFVVFDALPGRPS